MNAKAIETLSINAVRDSIVVSDFLDQYIADNDKEPSWDGSVYIYNDRSKKKSELAGRVPVQVKGITCDDFSKSEISHPVNIDDMNNYLNDGGVIYFVVYISTDGVSKKIYYQTLTPVKLKSYISEIKKTNNKKIKKQKTKNLKFIEFPNDNNRKATIFLNFYNNSKMQTSFSKTDIFSIEDLERLEEEDLVKQVSLTVSGYGYDKSRNDIHKAFLENEVYLYVDIKGSNISHPVDVIPINLLIRENELKAISTSGKKFYNKFSRIKSSEGTVVRIGDSLSIEINENARVAKFNYYPSPMLRKRAKDLEFFINVVNEKGFFIENVKMPFDLPDDEIRKINVDDQKKSLKYYSKMVTVLDTLHIDDDININELTEQERREFHNLVIAFVDKEPVPNLKPDLPTVCNINIANLKLMLVFEKHLNLNNTYNIYDFFNSNLALFYDTPDGDQLRTSLYSALQKEGYLQIKNIDYEAILSSYKLIEKENNEIFNRANEDLLAMLLAYDESGIKNPQLLKAAKDLAKWLLKDDKQVIPYEVKTLNYLQIIRREREFNIDEVKELCDIIADNSMGADIITGAYLLLSNQMAAEIFFEKMDIKLQETFKEFPIYKFWNKQGEM